MSDNTPARRENNTPSRSRDRTPRSYSFGDETFYNRVEGEAPYVVGRQLKLVHQCKLCTIVPTLMEDKGYTFEEATDTERDLYQMIYTMWTAQDIAKWARRQHELDISHDSVTRHISRHIPDPQIAMLDRVKTYRPDFMNKKFFMNMADTMKLAIMKYQGRIATGSEPLSTSDFLAIAKTLKDWQEFLGEIQSDKTERILEIVGETLTEVLDPYPEIKDEFTNKFRQKLEALETEEFEDE